MPEVSADDNGDVLTVVDGSWAKAAGEFAKIVIYNFATSGTTANLSNLKTVGDIKKDLAAGNIVMLYDNANYYSLLSNGNNVGNKIMFNAIFPNNPTSPTVINYLQIVFDSNKESATAGTKSTISLTNT